MRYQADASASSANVTSADGRVGCRFRVARLRLGARKPDRVAGDAAGRQPDRAVFASRRRDGEGGVVVRVGPGQGSEGSGGGLLVRDVEQQPVLAVRQEILERLGRLAARTRRAHRRADGQQGSLQVAPRRLGALAGTEVAADGALRADLAVGDVRCARSDRRRERLELRDRRRRADRDAGPVAGDPGEPGAGQQHRAFRAQPPARQIGDDDRSAADHRHARLEEGDSLLG